MIATINILDCFNSDAKTLKSEIVGILEQFFIKPESVKLKSMDGRFDRKKKKLIIDNFSFLVHYDSTYAQIPVETLGQILNQAYCGKVEVYALNV